MSTSPTVGPRESLDATVAASDGVSPLDQPDVLRRGTMLQRYVVLEQIGAGGMGVVYAAYDPELDRRLAVKLVHADQGGQRGSAGATRLLLEAQAMAKLSHPNVVVVHDVGTYCDQVFIAMEHLDGGTLRDWLRRDSPAWPDIVDKFIEAGAGLAAAHAAGLVHRDFKPENVMLSRDGRLRVMDFGLAIAEKTESRDGTAPTPATSFDSLPDRLTRTGSVVGTPAYMAPEQHESKPVDALSDQFAFCVSLYEGLYGQRPFEGNTTLLLAVEKRRGRIRPAPDGTDVPQHIDEVIRRGLSPDPQDRFGSMEELLGALRSDPTATRRSGRTAMVGLVVVAAAAAGFALARSEDRPCVDGRERIAEVWSPQARAQVQAAFEAVDEPFAADAYRQVARSIDGYTARWAEGYQDACEATRIRGEQSEHLLDLRMTCLSRRFSQLETLLEMFATADAPLVRSAHRVVDGLASVETCANAELLLGEPVPPDPATAQTVQRVQLAAAEAKLLTEAGRYDAAQRRLDSVAEEVATADYAPAQAVLLAAYIPIELRRGNWDRSEPLSYEAIEAAVKGNNLEVESEVWMALVSQLGAVQHRFAEAEIAAHAAEAALVRRGSPPLPRARLEAAMATVEVVRSNHAQAQRRFEHAVELYEQLGLQSTPDGWDARQGLALAHHAQGRYEEAATELEAITQEMTEELGPHHPLLGPMLGNWARTFTARGQFREAVELQLRALELLEIGWGPRSQVVASLHMNLSRAYRRLDDLPAARRHYEVGRDIDLELFGEMSDSHGLNIHDGAQLLRLEGKLDEALAEYRESLRILEKTLGPDHPQVAYPLTSIGRVLIELERRDEAVAPLKRALRIRESVEGVPPGELDRTRRALEMAGGG